jgi:hypothetical protein
VKLFWNSCIKGNDNPNSDLLSEEATMKLNESNTDRIIRAVAGVIVLYLGFGVLGGTLAIVADVVGVILVATAAIGFCPLYALLKFSTLKK